MINNVGASKLLQLTQNKILILDGAMGSLLQEQGLAPGELPERWCISHPDAVEKIHREYLLAGARLICTNTFGANSLKMNDGELSAVIDAAVGCAKRAVASVCRGDALVALDVGPLGRMLKPYGDLAFEDAVGIFKKTVSLGASAGADLVFIETMGDLGEARAALLAAKEVTDLPVCVSFAFGSDGRTLTGSSPEAVAATMSGMGACAVGANCSVGPRELIPVAERLVAYSDVPVLIKPNAGMPHTEGGRTVYDVSATELAECASILADMGVIAIGGCCGTTPSHIAAVANALSSFEPIKPASSRHTVVTSPSRVVEFGSKPILIGERVNPTGKKRFKEALREGDVDYIVREALSEEEAGCHLLDVNVGLPEIDEREMLTRAVSEIQAVCPLPLVIDTASPSAMEAALRAYNGRALINSVNGKAESMAAVFPLVKKYGGVVICLTLDEGGIPESAAERIKIAEKICEVAASYGIPTRDLIFDPLCMAVSADSSAAMQTLSAVKMLTEKGLYTSLGVSNVSFGLPDRDAVNSTFFAMALENGLSAAIMNPHSERMMATYHAFVALSGKDERCFDYIAFADGRERAVSEKPASLVSLSYAIIKGMKDVAADVTDLLLKDTPPMDIINGEIIPALNTVGEGFERGEIYLPSLLMSAEAASAAFARIKASVPSSGEKTRCTVVIATVKGDIHDIGKNIVRLLLENYGFPVIDLGKDVSPERIVAVARERGAAIVALSALMTTTVPAMAKTVELLRKEAPRVKIIVGGAVLTQDYADKIGADAYAPDAMGAVRYAEAVDSETNA